jgi:hypothetical protein
MWKIAIIKEGNLDTYYQNNYMQKMKIVRDQKSIYSPTG